MTDPPNLIRPPRLAAWLVNLFSAPKGAESILGDLQEEFSHLALQSGHAFARSWYWRHSIKTIAHLVGAGFRDAPWSTLVAILGGFLFMKFAFSSYQPAMTALLDRFRLYETHPDAYVFVLSEGNLIGHVILAMLVGAIVALVSKGREMIATTTLAVISSVLPIVATVYLLASGKHVWFWMLPWSLAPSLAFILAGVVVRTRRSPAPICALPHHPSVDAL